MKVTEIRVEVKAEIGNGKKIKVEMEIRVDLYWIVVRLRKVWTKIKVLMILRKSMQSKIDCLVRTVRSRSIVLSIKRI